VVAFLKEIYFYFADGVVAYQSLVEALLFDRLELKLVPLLGQKPENRAKNLSVRYLVLL
jgi:hypothetical protein